MASSMPTALSSDTLVTLKVNFLGSTRRFKLPLRDLGAHSLEDKIRTVLCISPEANATFERYSDSASSYVELDPANITVWKQLYRAAKAKQKLKLRVTLRDSEEEDKGPKPVTVEDEPEPVQNSNDFTQSKPEAPLIFTGNSDSTGSETEVTEPPAVASQIPNPFATFDERLEAAMSRLQLHSNRFAETTFASEQDTVQSAQISSPPTNRSVESTSSVCVAPKAANFAVCCNHCDRTIPDAHYHCSTCDDGDFDLCPECVEKGVTCYNADHWMLKRFVRGDFIVVSTTERISRKPTQDAVPAKAAPAEPSLPLMLPVPAPLAQQAPISRMGCYSGSLEPTCIQSPPAYARAPMRTCNSCVQELPDKEFLHCLACEDFDLCKNCFVGDKHGHHPQHAFAPAVDGVPVTKDISKRLAPGRAERHHAICDGCDKFIFGVRHKCLDCPDWDFCADCVMNANFIHPNHRFVPIYEQIFDAHTRNAPRPCHYGICCDGPLCNGKRKTYIVGERYKCTVCHDTDFCANCEASPTNTHNRTHPLIKFKTPVRRVEVTTKGEDEHGQQLPVMGDRASRKPVTSRATETSRASETSRGTETSHDAGQSSPALSIQPLPVVIPTMQNIEGPTLSQKTADSLVATYVSDTIADGTVMAPNTAFEQTWSLTNTGDLSWPAGCSVVFVGGDYMGHVDSSHPAGIRDLVSASESTVCYDSLAPGETFAFTVLLRTPAREGRLISYWRLNTSDGIKFGPRMWCDVEVKAPKPVELRKITTTPASTVETVDANEKAKSSGDDQSSQMIFPKLAKESPEESPEASIHRENIKSESLSAEEDDDTFLVDEEDGWVEDSDDGFLTDEEYDILDASDEEYLDDQQKKTQKK